MSTSPDSAVPAPAGAATAAGGDALRGAVASGEMLGIVGAPLALAAMLVERAGFDAVYLSGAAFSAGALGVPDIGLFTRDQLVEQTRILARSTTLPLVVDADTGFGGPREVEKTVRLLEAAGAAAIQLEDQLGVDKRCGHLGGKQVLDPGEMCDKLAAAATRPRSSSVAATPAVCTASTTASAGSGPTGRPAPTGSFPRRWGRATNSPAWAASSPGRRRCWRT